MSESKLQESAPAVQFEDLSESSGDSGSISSGMTREAAKPVPIKIADRETKVLWVTRVLVALLLAATAAAAGVTTYFLIERELENDFGDAFDSFAIEVVDAVDRRVNVLSSLLHTMANTLTTNLDTSVQNWPFVTYDGFEVLANNVRRTTGAQCISFSPLVGTTQLGAWNPYSVEKEAWVQDTHAYLSALEGTDMPDGPFDIAPQIYYRDDNGNMVVETEDQTEYAPVWQTVPAPQDAQQVNYNVLRDTKVHAAFEVLMGSMAKDTPSILSQLVDGQELYGSAGTTVDNHPQSLLMTHIMMKKDDEDMALVGFLSAVLNWDVIFEGLIKDESVPGIYAVVDNGECGDVFTYKIKGLSAEYLGASADLHDADLDHHVAEGDLAQVAGGGDCVFTYKVYPSKDFEAAYIDSNRPEIWTGVIVGIFVFIAAIFLVYDIFVQKRVVKTIDQAERSTAIVSSLFPDEVRERLYGHEEAIKKAKLNAAKDNGDDKHDVMAAGGKYALDQFLREDQNANTDTKAVKKINPESEKSMTMYETKPIADLFPNATVMFADIAGFTAWSSVREPSQVFTLLETIYRAFDHIAKKRKVFKVETVGDCYVAVTGLPEPRADHAVAMCKFSRDCLDKFNELVKDLEIKLGPDTGDLALRTGLHSGPVTAGVLRGDKSRFQLFGDTVNTAAKIESAGMKSRVHISVEVAKLLQEHGKNTWCVKREDAAVAKSGKLDIETYWLVVGENGYLGPEAKSNAPAKVDVIAGGNRKFGDTTLADLEASIDPKMLRLVAWNVEIMKKLLQQIIAKRNAALNKKATAEELAAKEKLISRRTNCLDEVVEIIHLPKFDAQAYKHQENPNKIVIPANVVEQLRLFVTTVAAMYRDNPFHNFEHASHVTMSVNKLLSRIIAPDDILKQDDGTKDVASSLHDHTYGITSDPLTQFSVVLAALIHDVDHSGVSNFQLIKEGHKQAKFFKGKSVAEQNSIVLAWEKLMSPRFKELRECIYQDTADLERFRQLITNTVLATDIFDKELTGKRKARWEAAFNKDKGDNVDMDEEVNRKATIVIEHLIQASDVAHTMQHWHIYQKWNERLFAEMTKAYQAGRMGNNPADGWYQGEIGFFDNYVIPLAKKLKECGVFGVSSDEYLNYALENRREWASKGEAAVARMIETYSKKDEGEDTKKKDGESKKEE